MLNYKRFSSNCITKVFKPSTSSNRLSLLNFKRNIFNKTIPDKSVANTEVYDLIKRPLNIPKEKMLKIGNLNEAHKNSEKLKQILFEQISLKGPIGIDEYMKTCLYDKNYGYYTTKENIFDEKGDFITSPEISQMFGETIAIFLFKILEESFNSPKSWEILEIGAGRGFLMADIINSMIDFKSIEGMNVVIVETSDKLAKIQQENINSILLKKKIFTEYEYDKVNKIDVFIDKKRNFSMKWFNNLDHYITYRNGIILEDPSKNPFRNWQKFTTAEENPNLKPLMIINNEFFDALPIKKFIYKNNAWCEILVDVEKPEKKDSSSQSNTAQKIKFKYTYSAPNSESVLKILQPESTFDEAGIKPKENNTYEFSAEQVRFMYALCYLMATTRLSAGLIIDYGEEHAFSNSFRGIKSQKILREEEVLNCPGECDLTAYVNFKALRRVVYTYYNNIRVGGIMKQGDFLEILQIYNRMTNLQKNTNNMKKKEILFKQYNRLADQDEMGDVYKFMYIHKKRNKPVYPFTEEAFKLIEQIEKNSNL